MTYFDSVQYLYAIANESKTVRLGLERIVPLMRALDDPQDRLRIVHVAGTNGKGSTCAMIESGLRASGASTGLFTSPHFSEPSERIRIGGRPISEERFADVFLKVRAAVDRVVAAGEIAIYPSYFEVLTAMGFVAFEEAKVDYAVVEVGMGGAEDATNVVRPALCVITTIDFDHEAALGKGLESIAGHKAGILKRGVPAVLSRQRPEVDAVLRERSGALAIPVSRTEDRQVERLELHRRGSHFGLGDLEIECPLAGEHQVENTVTAVLALERLHVPPEAIERGIRTAVWPGRLERVSEHPEVILDGAHNPSGARALAAYIDRFYAETPITLIFGATREKAVAEVAGILFPLAARVIVTAPQQPRALAPDVVRELVEHPNLHVAPDIASALRMAGDETVFVTGSLFLVGEARSLFAANAHDHNLLLRPIDAV